MVADWKWDSERKGKKTGLSKSLYSYRNQCAIWAIKTYATQKYRKQKKDQSSIQHSIENSTYTDLSDPSELLAHKEESDNLARDIKELINAAPLTDKQKQQVILYYYDNKTLSEIGKIYNVSREAVRQNINKSINILRFYANSN
jgi:RNA polymerase sigma factor (sigma-70 family)